MLYKEVSTLDIWGFISNLSLVILLLQTVG